MALNLKNPEVEKLATEVAALAGETKTEAVRRALVERRDRLTLRHVRLDRRASLLRVLQRDIWPRIPEDLRGRGFTKAEREAILGYGPEGV
jgi:antitoxin VapB